MIETIERQEPTFRSDFTVDLVGTTVQGFDDDAGIEVTGDDMVLQAMLVSTGRDGLVTELTEADKLGKIRYLMRNRHGTPFEHNSMIFRSEAPIVVYREWHRHRIGVSINEMSGRYTELPGVFYIPPRERPLVQTGKVGHYTFAEGDDEMYEWLVADMTTQARFQFASYQERLLRGYAKEVARMSLGVNIYSSMYWTCNARSLMAFLSLRTRHEPFWIDVTEQEFPNHGGGPYFAQQPGGAMFPSGPMWEIEASARACEQVFQTLFPLTYSAFCEFGRVCP